MKARLKQAFPNLQNIFLRISNFLRSLNQALCNFGKFFQIKMFQATMVMPSLLFFDYELKRHLPKQFGAFAGFQVSSKKSLEKQVLTRCSCKSFCILSFVLANSFKDQKMYSHAPKLCWKDWYLLISCNHCVLKHFDLKKFTSSRNKPHKDWVGKMFELWTWS